MDYSSLGLNQFLQPVNSPVGQNSGAISGYDFNAQNERNIIDGAKIRNFSFNAGTGGTIQLGGVANGNGYLTVQNSAGSTIVTINNTGITVEGGNVVIKDAGGTTVLDSLGLVGTTSFISGNSSAGGNQDTTSSTLTDVTASSLSFVLQRTTPVLFLLSCAIFNLGANSTSGESGIAQIVVDGTAQTPLIVGRTTQYSDFSLGGATHTTHTVLNLAAGTHTAKIQFKTGGNGTARIIDRSLTYLVLGK